MFGALISSSGHVTDALLAVFFTKQWHSYYKALECGTFHCRDIVNRWFLLCLQVFIPDTIVIALDDTQVLRSSKKAPGVDTHFDHAPKANQKNFVSSQLFVSLFFIVSSKVKSAALPIWLQLMSKDGNRSKLRTAKILVLWLLRFLSHSKKLLLLIDSWYMKASLITPLLKQGIHIIGQIRKDSVLFLPPVRSMKRGRPRKYGVKLS
ncbi:MAG: transposase, partial [Synergistaceae bacterium]|nr:transposase [Synergistaceae bacterium]